MEKFEKDLKNKKLHVKYVNWMIRGVKNYLSGKNTNGLALPQLTDITNWKTHQICFTSTSNCVFYFFFPVELHKQISWRSFEKSGWWMQKERQR